MTHAPQPRRSGRQLRRLWSPRARWLAFAVVAVVFVGALFLAQGALLGRDAELTSFQRTGDASAIVVNVGMGIGEVLLGSSTVEDANSVRVTVRVRRAMGSVPAILLSMPMVVRLNAALRERTVLDSVGRPIPDLGEYVGPRPVPTR
ncbi:MAG: hypothetical protein QOH08_1091 [Chloroflexota bacterium]|nr:hypothetical protein [Chloroflexota bacterium]